MGRNWIGIETIGIDQSWAQNLLWGHSVLPKANSKMFQLELTGMERNWLLWNEHMELEPIVVNFISNPFSPGIQIELF